MVRTVTVPIGLVSSIAVTSYSLGFDALTNIQLNSLLPVSWLAAFTALSLC